jgi:hypothetical protein
LCNASAAAGPVEIFFDRSATGSTQIAAVGMEGANRNFFIWVNGSDRFNITNSGNVGIGTASPSYPLHVTGAIYATGDITAFSDARYKTDLVPLTNCLEKITKLNGYTYTRTDYEQLKEPKDTRHIGLIAQEVQDVFPDAVIYDEKNDRFGVNYGGLVASLVEAMKEMKIRINELETIVRSNKSL